MVLVLLAGPSSLSAQARWSPAGHDGYQTFVVLQDKRYQGRAAVNRPDEQNVSQPLTGLGAGEGLIVVPASNLLVAYPSVPTTTYTISGQVTDGFGNSISGATVSLSGAQTATTTTNSSGNYSFPNLPGGNYQVGASLPGRQDTLTFAVDVNNLSSDLTKNLQILFFVTFQVWVRDASGIGLPGVCIKVNSDPFPCFLAGTNAFGMLNVGVSVPFTGTKPPATLTPEKSGYVFSPPSVTLSTQNGNQVVNFTALAAPTIQFSSATYTVSETGPRVEITLTRSGSTTAASAINYATSDISGANNCNVTNGNASARCDYLTTLGVLRFAANETVKTILVPIVDDSYAEGPESFTIALSSPSGATLGAPATSTITINDNDATNGTNPVDETGFFVRQHYLDFLNREPDSSGFAFWTGQIDNCTPKPQCTEVTRINVSASFFLSIEFQGTGYLVERIYKTAYGNASGISTFGGTHSLPVPVVRLNEFLADTQQIGQGVIVGQGNWQQQLENNKQAFAAEFVQRSRFTTAFPSSMTPAQFVDALNTNAGNVLSSSERATAIGLFGSATNTSDATVCAQVLRAVAEDADLVSAESNRAFVLMQYFGYLRRNPNDPQDSDYTGYDFWLTKLNQFNGNFINAEMVKAFISSIEYRQRFGP